MKNVVQDMQWKKDQLQIQHLILHISNSFLSAIRLLLAGHRTDSDQIKYSDGCKHEELQTTEDHLISDKKGKLMPMELPLLSLCIGSKKVLYMFRNFSVLSLSFNIITCGVII
jgi:hypothetical protein